MHTYTRANTYASANLVHCFAVVWVVRLAMTAKQETRKAVHTHEAVGACRLVLCNELRALVLGDVLVLLHVEEAGQLHRGQRHVVVRVEPRVNVSFG